MSMDLTVKCPHCDAGKGEMCEDRCSANGNYIKKLNTVLHSLNLKREKFKLVSSRKKM